MFCQILLFFSPKVAAQQGAYAARLLNRGYNLTSSPKPRVTKAMNPVLPLVRGVQVIYHINSAFFSMWRCCHVFP
jgi:hypothetical protein